MKKKIWLLSGLFLLFFTSVVWASDESAEVYLKAALKQLHLVENFQGEIVTRINFPETTLTYRTGILRDGSRADVSTRHTFWQLKGTEKGRMIRAIPWFYLPPDFSLVQYALPIQRYSTIDEPLVRIGYDYDVQIIEENQQEIVFLLSNGFIDQRVTLDRNLNVITRVKVTNAAEEIMALIEYVNWKKYYSGLFLPESIRVRGGDGRVVLEMTYVNWKVNQGVDGFAKTLPRAWNESVEALKIKILEDPANDRLHYQLAMLYKQEKFFSDALEELDKALALHPKLEYREEMAQIYDVLGQTEEALNQMLVVIESGEDGPRNYFLGNLYAKLNNPMLARNAYERALEFDQDNLEYWQRLFWNYRNISFNDQRMLRRAIQVGERLVAMEPENYQHRLNLGNLYVENKQLTLALEAYTKAQELEPEESLPYVKLAKYYEQVGQIDQALKALQDAIKVFDHWWNYLQLGDFYLRQADIEAALLAYEQSLQMNPQNTDLNIKIGKVLWQLGREADAKKYWYQALQFAETNIYTYIKVGEIFLQYNLIEEAEEVFLRAIDRFQLLGDQSIEPGLSQIYEKIGLLYLEKRPLYAIECFTKADQIQARSKSSLYLGLWELSQGQLNLATKYWTQSNLLEGDDLEAVLFLTVVQGLRGEILGSLKQELAPLDQYLTGEQWELMHKFFSYFPGIHDLKNQEETTPEAAREKYEIGMAFFQRGDLNLARDYLSQAIQLDPHYLQGHFFLGVVFSLMGADDSAETHLQAVQDYYGGSHAARIASTIAHTIERLFWKIKFV